LQYPSESPICIVGGGAGGLSAAFYLRSAGYTNVTVLEKADHIGGKCHSSVVDGVAYDMGALEVTPSYVRVLPLIEKYQLEMTNIGGILLMDYANGQVHHGSYLMKGLSFFQDLEVMKDIAKYFLELSETDDSLKGPGFRNLPAELAKPFSAWLADKDMATMAQVFALPVTCYGYGPLDQVPAAYVLKYLDKTDYTMLIVDFAKDLFGKVGAWPKRLLTGYQSLMQHMADDMTATGTTRVLTGADIGSIRRNRPGSHPIKVEYRHGGASHVEEFDHLILASLLTEDALGFVDLTGPERAMFSQVKVCNYYTSLCEIPGLELGTYAMVVKDGAIVPPPAGTPCMIIKSWENTDLVVVYTYSPEALSIPDVEARVRTGMAAAKLDLRGIHETFVWPYFPHVEEAALAAGFYDTLTGMMGQNATWYAGGLMNFEDVQKCFEWSHHLVEHHFA
jgi:flavin-dependent amine oxidoreductase